MTEPPDLETLARRYLDLWQDHLGTMARDPAVSEAMAHAFTLMTQGLAEAARTGSAPAGGQHDPSDAQKDRSDDTPGGATGSPAAGPASDRPEPDDHELAARVERLEQRVAVLEAALGGLLSRAGGA
jgi:hypothetical protein